MSTVFLIDGHSQMYRAYHALRGLTGPDGRSTNAVYGFFAMLQSLVKDQRPAGLAVAFDLPGLPVDTHVGRLSRRLGLTTEEDPVKVERELCALVPPAEWGRFSLRLILHGRRVCDARKPQCGICELAWMCPSVVPESPKKSAPRV